MHNFITSHCEETAMQLEYETISSYETSTPDACFAQWDL